MELIGITELRQMLCKLRLIESHSVRTTIIKIKTKTKSACARKIHCLAACGSVVRFQHTNGFCRCIQAQFLPQRLLIIIFIVRICHYVLCFSAIFFFPSLLFSSLDHFLVCDVRQRANCEINVSFLAFVICQSRLSNSIFLHNLSLHPFHHRHHCDYYGSYALHRTITTLRRLLHLTQTILYVRIVNNKFFVVNSVRQAVNAEENDDVKHELNLIPLYFLSIFSGSNLSQLIHLDGACETTKHKSSHWIHNRALFF